MLKDTEEIGYRDAIYFHFIDFKRKINGLYFLYDHKNGKILGMKTDSQSQPTKLLRFFGNDQPGRTIRAGYGHGGFHSHLILNKERKNLFCFNPFKSTLFPLQSEDRKHLDDEIVDFVTLPYMQVISMSRNGMLCLHSYEKTDPNSPKIESTVKLDLSLSEDCYSMTVCPLFTFIAVCVINSFNQKTSRVFIIQLISKPLQLLIKASLKMKEGVNTPALNLIFYDYYQKNLLFTGVSNSRPTNVISFIFDSQNCAIREFMTRSEIPDMGGICRLSRIEDVDSKVGKSVEPKDLLLRMNKCVGIVGVTDKWDFVWVKYLS